MRRKRFRIYQSRWHLLVTISFLVLPFVALLIFSQRASGASHILLADVLFSFWRMLIAYVIAAVFGWTFAVLLHRGKWSKVGIPLFDVLQSFPNFAALPLAASVWGASDFTVIFFLIFTIIWPIFFSIVGSLKLIKSDWEEAVIITRLSGISYLRYFLIPVSVSGLITGSIIGLGEAWEALVATEIIVKTPVGIGDFLGRYAKNPTVTAFGMLGFLLVIFCINKLVWLPLLDWSHQNLEE